MQRLLLRGPDGELSEQEMCESSHEFIGRPGISPFLKLILGPAVLVLQLNVFVAVFSRVAYGACTDYSVWERDVRRGLPLAIGYVSAEIAAQMVRILRLFLFGIYSGSRWAILGSLCMMVQTGVEIATYSLVMGLSTSIVELIQNFVALAVTNEADDKVAKIIGVRGSRAMFLDAMDKHEWCPLSRESVPPPTTFWGFLQGLLCCWRGRRSSLSRANYFCWPLTNSKGWPLRCALFAGVFATITWIVLTVSDNGCGYGGTPDSRVGYVYHGLRANATLYGWLADQNLTYAQFFTNASIVSFSGPNTPIEFDLKMPSGFSFNSYSGQYSRALLFPNGYLELTDFQAEVYWYTLFTQTTDQAVPVIAPFFADLDVSTGTVYLATLQQDFVRNGYDSGSNTYVSSSYVRSSVVIVFDGVEVSAAQSWCLPGDIANGICNPQNNKEACGFDGGDCCASTCGLYSVQEFMGADYTPTTSSSSNYEFCDPRQFHYFCLQSKQDPYFAKNDLLFFMRNSSMTLSFELVFSDDGRVRISYPSALQSEVDAFQFDGGFTIGIDGLSCTGKYDCHKIGIGPGDSIYSSDFTSHYDYIDASSLHFNSNCTEAAQPCLGPGCECVLNVDLLFPPAPLDDGESPAAPIACYSDSWASDGVVLGDGICNERANIAACSYDNGDCCFSTCQSAPPSYNNCKKQTYDKCIDPCAEETTGYMMCSN